MSGCLPLRPGVGAVRLSEEKRAPEYHGPQSRPDADRSGTPPFDDLAHPPVDWAVGVVIIGPLSVGSTASCMPYRDLLFHSLREHAFSLL